MLAIVRAIPPHGFRTRMRARKRWTTEPREVQIADAIAPCDGCKGERKVNGAVCVACGGSGESAGQITPADLAEIQADPHMAVQVAGDGDIASLELNAAKVKIGELQVQLADARRELSGQCEQTEHARAKTKEIAEELGGKVALLTAQVSELESLIARGKGGKK